MAEVAGGTGWLLRLVCTIFVCCLTQTTQASVDPLIMVRVTDRIAAGDAAGAIALLEQAITDPDTPPAEQADLLTELALLRGQRGDHADAGEAIALKAELLARLKGSRAPDLASLYAAAAAAYLRAGDAAEALGLAEAALAADIAYHACDSTVIALDYARLAEILDALGDDRADDKRRLAGDASERCADPSLADGPRAVVVETDTGSATPDSFARVKVFYATDRARSGSDRPNDFYSGERGELETGVLEITVPRIHKAGEIEAPSILRLEWSENPERHYVITRLAPMPSADMFADMRATLDERRSDEAFLFIHGFNVTFAEAAKRTAQIAYDLNFDGAPILYSWPSRGSTFAYIRDEAVVRLSARRLLRFLDEVVAESGARRINLIAHSMGGRALTDALELIGTRRTGEGAAAPLFTQVIFAAPDVDAGLFQEMIATISPLARRLTLYGSDNDIALTASSRIHGEEPRAGQGGAILVADVIDSIDMSALGADMLGHGYFASTASALTDMLWLFWRDTSPEKRCGLDARAAPHGRYYEFDPIRCDGAAILAALTLLRSQGAAALAHVEDMLARSGTTSREAEEWQAIRDAMLAGMTTR